MVSQQAISYLNDHSFEPWVFVVVVRTNTVAKVTQMTCHTCNAVIAETWYDSVDLRMPTVLVFVLIVLNSVLVWLPRRWAIAE